MSLWRVLLFNIAIFRVVARSYINISLIFHGILMGGVDYGVNIFGEFRSFWGRIGSTIKPS